MKAVRIVVHGRVQGVYYRQSTLEKAKKLNIKGTVRNRDDGTVEIFAEGEDQAIRSLIEWCHVGPAGSKVSKVDIHEGALKNFSDFNITR